MGDGRCDFMELSGNEAVLGQVGNRTERTANYCRRPAANSYTNTCVANLHHTLYSSAPVCMGNTFQDLSRLIPNAIYCITWYQCNIHKYGQA
jgi:hypothetical protein